MAFSIDKRSSARRTSVISFDPIGLIAGTPLVTAAKSHNENLTRIASLLGAIREHSDIADITIVRQLIAARQRPNFICESRRSNQRAKRKTNSRSQHPSVHKIPHQHAEPNSARTHRN